jgi:hypothetical protein
MKTLIYQVYTGKRSKLYDHCTYSVAEYAKRIGAEYIQQRQPILMIKPDPFMTNRSKESYEKYGGFLPIYEKENALVYLKSYDKVAVIDADVWVRPEVTESIFDDAGDAEFAGVLERDMPITQQYERKIANYSRMQYGTSPINKLFDWKDKKGRGADFYNMGIMVLNKSIQKYLRGETPHQFLRRPEFKAFIDGQGAWKWSTDQTLLNVWVKEEKMKVINLHWKWNGLYTANTKIKECNFVHFFLKDKLPNKGENVEELMKHVS